MKPKNGTETIGRNAARDAVEFEKHSLTDILGMKFKKIAGQFYEK